MKHYTHTNADLQRKNPAVTHNLCVCKEFKNEDRFSCLSECSQTMEPIIVKETDSISGQYVLGFTAAARGSTKVFSTELLVLSTVS